MRTMIRAWVWGAAVAAALVLGPLPGMAQELELYGNFRYSVNWVSPNADSYWTGAGNAARAGLRGALDGDDWEAFYHLEVGASVDGEGDAFVPRFYLGGLRSPLGTLTVGRMTPAYKAPALRLDPFYDTSTTSATGGVPYRGNFQGASYGLSTLSDGWARRGLTYQTPEHEGFTADAGLYLDPEGNADWALGVTYEVGDLEAGVNVHDHRSQGRNWTNAALADWGIRGHGIYSAEPWTVGLSIERVEMAGDEAQILAFGSGAFQVSDEARLALALGNVGSVDAPSPPAGLGVHGGGFYELTEGAEVYALVSMANLDDLPDREVLSAGLSVDFGWTP